MNSFRLIEDDSEFDPSISKSATKLTLIDCLTHQLLISPNSKLELKITDCKNFLTDNKNFFDIQYGCPILYPNQITENWNESGFLPLTNFDNPLQQYALLSQIKQQGEINAPLKSVPALKHQYRFANFCKNLTGIVLDVGSDIPSHSVQLLPQGCSYLGLDPYGGAGEFRIVGLGEILPVQDSSVDAVIFNTSLDHILDYHTAVEEAYRVLKPNGKIIVATYVWIKNATLLTDSVHFHHFREFEILGVLKSLFKIDGILRYEDPKNEKHRFGLYVQASRLNE